MTTLNTDHLNVSSVNTIFLMRLADQEVDRMASRLKSRGVNSVSVSHFHKSATTVLTRAIHEDPKQILDDIDRVIEKVSRTALGAKRRSEISNGMSASMRRSAVLLNDQAQPQVISDPFADSAPINPSMIEQDESPCIA